MTRDVRAGCACIWPPAPRGASTCRQTRAAAKLTIFKELRKYYWRRRGVEECARCALKMPQNMILYKYANWAFNLWRRKTCSISGETQICRFRCKMLFRYIDSICQLGLRHDLHVLPLNMLNQRDTHLQIGRLGRGHDGSQEVPGSAEQNITRSSRQSKHFWRSSDSSNYSTFNC